MAQELAVFLSGEDARRTGEDRHRDPRVQRHAAGLGRCPVDDRRADLPRRGRDRCALPTSKNTTAWVPVEEDYIKQILSGQIDTETGLKDLPPR